MNTLYLVIPCYNEQEVLPETAKRLLDKLNFLIKAEKISPNSKILLVDDGSSDKTGEIIEALHNHTNKFSGIFLSKNSGHQNALLSGMFTASKYADMVITLDADLQDDINAIDEMIDCYNNGCEIVYGVRKSREKDTFFKKTTANMFYKLIKALGAKTIDNHADFRLMSKRAINELSKFEEVNLFLRGIVPMLGFKSDIVLYERQKRFAGDSKYPFSKMILFAIEGITSLSTKPLKLITITGFSVFIASLIMLVYAFISFFTGVTVQGWSSVVISVWALGGITLLSLGCIGEYVGKIYLETKKRPRYINDRLLHKTDENTSEN